MSTQPLLEKKMSALPSPLKNVQLKIKKSFTHLASCLKFINFLWPCDMRAVAYPTVVKHFFSEDRMSVVIFNVSAAAARTHLMITLDGWPSYRYFQIITRSNKQYSFCLYLRCCWESFFAVNYPLFMFGRILITPSLVISVGGREKKTIIHLALMLNTQKNDNLILKFVIPF